MIDTLSTSAKESDMKETTELHCPDGNINQTLQHIYINFKSNLTCVNEKQEETINNINKRNRV